MGDLLWYFTGRVWVRPKHVEKFGVDFWGQSMMLKVAKLVVDISKIATYEELWQQEVEWCVTVWSIVKCELQDIDN